MIHFSLPISISSHLRKEKPTHTQLHTQQLKIQKKRNPKYPYQQMKRRNQEWLIPILANTGLLGFDKERSFGSIEKKKLRVLQCQNEVSRLSPLFVCRSHPLPSLFLMSAENTQNGTKSPFFIKPKRPILANNQRLKPTRK